jgi:hypothetical protein
MVWTIGLVWYGCRCCTSSLQPRIFKAWPLSSSGFPFTVKRGKCNYHPIVLSICLSILELKRKVFVFAETCAFSNKNIAKIVEMLLIGCDAAKNESFREKNESENFGFNSIDRFDERVFHFSFS